MTKVFIDTNIAIDLLCERYPWFDDASELFSMANIEKKNIKSPDIQFSAEDYQALLLQAVAVIESARSAVARHLMAPTIHHIINSIHLSARVRNALIIRLMGGVIS